MTWRLVRLLMFAASVLLLVLRWGDYVHSHEQVRPVHATASVFAAAYNNLFHVVTK